MSKAGAVNFPCEDSLGFAGHMGSVVNIYRVLSPGPGIGGDCSFHYYFHYSSFNIQRVYESKNSAGIFG